MPIDLNKRIEIGNRLRQFAKVKFGRYESLAKALGMTPQSLNNYLTGKRLPGAELISKLKELGCNTDWLLLHGDEPYPIGVSDATNSKSISAKDKVILSQAEQIQQLREELKALKEEILKAQATTKKSKKGTRK